MLTNLILFICCISFVCQGTEKPSIVVSIITYKDILTQLVGEEIEVDCLIPENVDFHTYEPTIKQMDRYKKAAVWFCIGDPFENRIAQFFESQPSHPQRIILPHSRGSMSPCCCHEDGEEQDPHAWTNPAIMQEQIDFIASKLLELFPQYAEGIQVRHRELSQQMRKVISKVYEVLLPSKGKAIIIAHAAFGNLCHEYGITQIALENGGKEPTLKTMEIIFQEAVRRHITTLFSLKGHSKKGIEQLALMLSAKIVEIDPYVYPYIPSILHIANAFRDSFEEEKS